MSLNDFLRLLRERWPIIVACVTLGLLGAGVASYLSPPQYTSTVTMFVSAQVPADNPSAAYEGSLLSQQRMKSYTQLVTSERLSQEVINQLGLPETAATLAQRITVSSELDTVIISAGVEEGSPAQAARVANAVGDAFVKLVAVLEAPSAAGEPTLIVARILQPATPPTTATSPKHSVDLALGLIVGLVVGLGAAVLRHFLDSSVKSEDQLGRVLGCDSIGSIAFDGGVSKRPLIVHESTQAPRAEAFRKIRTNLKFLDIDSPPKVIVLTSAVAGEGKTMTVCNLAIAMAEMGGRVLVIEADLRRPRAADLFGLERGIGLTNVLTGEMAVEIAVQNWWGGSFDVLASGNLPPNPSKLLGSKQMVDLIDKARRLYDFVLIDTPPLLPVTDTAALVANTDGAILVVRYGKTSCQDVEAATKTLHAASGTLLGGILSMDRTKKSRGTYESFYASDELVEIYGADTTIGSASTNGHSTARSAATAPESPMGVSAAMSEAEAIVPRPPEARVGPPRPYPANRSDRVSTTADET